MSKNNIIHKNALLAQIASKCSSEIKDVGVINTVLQALHDTVLENINNGYNTRINGFLSFDCIEIKARLGTNPKTGERISIPAQKRASVKLSDSFQNKIQQDIGED